MELRSPAPSCNSYLTFAAILTAGIDGIKNKIDPREPVEANIFDLTEEERNDMAIGSLPNTLKDASYYLSKNEMLKKALGSHVHDNILRLAKAEWDAYRVKIHDWKIQRYLNTI